MCDQKRSVGACVRRLGRYWVGEPTLNHSEPMAGSRVGSDHVQVRTSPDSVTTRDGLRLSLAIQGDGSRPVVMLLPGPTDSWRSYQPVLHELPPRVGAIAVSQRGHGDSDKPASGYGIEDFSADVIALLDALGVERTVLVGHSGSCLTARSVAIDHPQRVGGLILEASPTTLTEDPAFRVFVESVVSGLEDPIDAAFVRSFVADTSSDDTDPELLEEFVGELLKVPARVWHQTFGSLLRYDDTHLLERIAAPTLLIWGDRDRLVGRQAQEALRAQIADAELLVYPGAGHAPRLGNPSRFASDITCFVERVAT